MDRELRVASRIGMGLNMSTGFYDRIYDHRALDSLESCGYVC